MVLHRDLGELLLGRAVLPHVLHARLSEDRRHEAAADDALGADAGTASATREEPHLPHLLDPDGQRDVVLPRRDGHPRLAEGGRAGGAGIRDVHHRDARLADLLQDALTDHRVRLEEAPRGQQLDVAHGESSVGEGEERRFRPQIRHVAVGVASEPDHADSGDEDLSHDGVSL